MIICNVGKNNVVVYSQHNIVNINDLIGSEVLIEHSLSTQIEQEIMIPAHYSVYIGDSGGHFIGYCEGGIHLKRQIASTGARSYRLLMQIETEDMAATVTRELRRVLPGKPRPKNVLVDRVRAGRHWASPSLLMSEIESVRAARFPQLHSAIWGTQNKLLQPVIFRRETPLAGSRIWLKKNMPISMRANLLGILGNYALTSKGLIPLSGFEFVKND